MSFDNLPRDVNVWVSALSEVEIPVLNRTIEELARLKENESKLVARDISQVLLHDAMFSLRVIRFLPTLRKSSHLTEITTVEHALMMMGLTPFFRHFEQMPAVESLLENFPEALSGLLQVMDRARHAALYARDWASVRHDVESEEIVIAALLHDLAEMLLWCFAPRQALQIKEMQQQDHAMRSSVAQKTVLGFALHDLQLALIKEWKLPDMLQMLMDDAHPTNSRTQNVILAVNLARHSAHGWDDPALPDDYAAIQKFLALDIEELQERIVRVANRAASEQGWYSPAAVQSADLGSVVPGGSKGDT